MQEDNIFASVLAPQAEFVILKQSVDLDIDFVRRSIRGSTEITLQPLSRDLKRVRLHCRQCRPTSVQVQGMNARWECDDPYSRMRMPGGSTVYQHEMLKSKIESSIGPAPEPELEITLPPKLKFQEIQVDPISSLPQYVNPPSLQKQESDAMAVLETPTTLTAGQGPQFTPIMVYIEFEVENIRDGLHWIGLEEDDNRYPHLYTMSKLSSGTTSCIFPCLDDATSRYSWDIRVRCAKTLGDAFRRPQAELEAELTSSALMNGSGTAETGSISTKQNQFYIDLTEEDAARELVVLCIGDMIEEITDSEDDSRHTVSFSISQAVTARHIGFAVGPFEQVNLGAFRETADEERLGQNAIKINGYCLPTRGDELRNTGMPIHLAIDFFGVNYGSFPFSHYQMLFLDDLVYDTVPLAGFTFCSTRLLFPVDILEPMTRNTKTLIRAVADQWMGVNVIPKEASDAWVIAGIAGFMSDLFGKRLFGNNDYRWSQKVANDEVYRLDADRPSLHQLGSLLHLDDSIRDFVNLKSALVLSILDRRLMKASSSTGVTRIINKIFMNAKTGSLLNGELSTIDFQRTCEKLGHNKLEPFFRHWVFGAGCPILAVEQKFNKKKLVVELTITQRQHERLTKPEFAPDNFMREIKEHVQEVWAPEVQTVFTGPMTIRIHEADGTPYEHIVEIKDKVTKLDIPYNTKYKRLKRSKRQKAQVVSNGEPGEGGDDALLYCLGDILDTEDEMEDWRLLDWSEDDTQKMRQENYEWIRMDADFEWIGRIHLWQPVYMYVSQLQQDRDLAAQYDSIKYIESCKPHQVSMSVLVRTLMDQRYFHGLRTMAANVIAAHSKDDCRELGQFYLEKAFSSMFCFTDSIMPRPNDWTSRVSFIMQCAIPTAMSKLRDIDGKVPMSVRRFFVDKLKFNDNSNNEFSDVHYVATLMSCLADALAASHREKQQQQQPYHFDFGAAEPEPMDVDNPDANFEKGAVNEIERYRRIDEWISTYQNVYSVTALESLQKLTKAGIVKDKTRELLIYTRRTNAASVRLAAYRCLNEIGVSKKPSMLKYMLHELADDASPYFRSRLLALFGEALGHIALEEEVEKPALAPSDNDTGLVLEQEATTEARHLRVSRKGTPEGALAMLRRTLAGEASFRNALWYAVTARGTTVDEVGELTEIASLLFDAKTSYMVKLKLPRSYRAERVGPAVVRFWQFGEYRSVPRKPLRLEDWQSLQKLALKYGGLLAPEVQQEISAQETLRSQIAALQQQATMSAEAQQRPHDHDSGAMRPPLPPLNTEKSGIKISIGAAKRKHSVATPSAEESPKPPKLIKLQSTANHATSESIVSQHKKKTGAPSMIVKWPITLNLSRRITAVMSVPSKPSHRQSATPRATQQPSGHFAGLPQSSPELFRSPSVAATPAQPQTSFNVGGFRSYGPSEPTFTETEQVQSPAVKSDTEDHVPLTSIPHTVQSPAPLSPHREVTVPQNDQQRPVKKFSIKLGKRPQNE